MEDRSVNHPPAACHDDPARCWLAIELSKTRWLVALCTPLADKVSLHELAGGDVPALLALIARTRAQVEAALGRPVEVISCYEAGYDGFWLHRLLERHGVRNHVLDPASLHCRWLRGYSRRTTTRGPAAVATNSPPTTCSTGSGAGR